MEPMHTASSDKRKGRNPERGLEPRACVVCGSTFQPYRSYHATCSRPCSDRDPNKGQKRIWSKEQSVSCALCGNHFVYVGPYRKYCDPCQPEARRQAQQRKNVARNADPDRRQKTLRIALKSLYGLTWDQYQAMLETQGGQCAICGATPDPNGIKASSRLHVDHDHETGKVRALLCNRCNQGIGYFRDDPGYMRRAAGYIEQHRANVAALASNHLERSTYVEENRTYARHLRYSQW